MANPLFSGPSSLRDPAERLAFWLTLVFAFPAAGALGFLIHEEVGVSRVALFIVVAMLYVTVARGRLLGSSIMIHEAQYPRVFAIVKRACAALEIPMPVVFVREDYFVPAATMGFGEPYALVLSSHWIEQFQDDELAFVIGRQLGHIAAGHTRFYSLLSVNGNENPVISLIFGAWLRRCELTCDRVGLLVCGSLDAAMRAIAVSSFHHFGRQVDVGQFAEQGEEISHDSVLRLGEWLGAEPYATKRIAHMRRFVSSHQFEVIEAWFLRERGAEPPALPSPGGAHVQKSDCVGWWRRLAALTIDAIVVWAVMGVFAPQEVAGNNQPATSVVSSSAAHGKHPKQSVSVDINGDNLSVLAMPSDKAPAKDWQHWARSMFQVALVAIYPFWLCLYLVLLVALVGQSFGMMITGVRVVTTDYRRPGIWQTVFRYGIGLVLSPFIAILSPIYRRVMLHDKLTGTRLISSERFMARTLASPA